MKKILTFVLAVGAMLMAAGADQIGIAEPAIGSQFSTDDALAIWDELEASFHSKDYTLISRAALKQMMTEIGIVTSSDLLNMNETQKAKLGQLRQEAGAAVRGKVLPRQVPPLPRCSDRPRLQAQGDPSLSVYREYVCVCMHARNPSLSVYRECVCVCVCAIQLC